MTSRTQSTTDEICLFCEFLKPNILTHFVQLSSLCTTTYVVLQVSPKPFYHLDINPTVRRIDKTDTMINSIMAMVHRRPVGVNKITDIVKGRPAVAHYN